MSLHPQDSSQAPSSSRAIDQNISVLTETKIKSFSTNHKETSRDDVQSFVIVNDIDVEEELNKAQKEGHRNFFKMLSMSFYGKVKSHSLDTQEMRENQKYNMSPQTAGHKPSFARKASAHTPPESKREALNGFKQKTQGVLKKAAPLIKDLPLTPEQFRRHILSPKDASIKMYSPVVIGKHCPGTMTSKDETKKEVAGFFREVQQRPQTCKKTGSGRRADSGKKSGSSENKTPISKDDTSTKANVFKLSRYPQKTSEQTEERVHMTNVEPSGLDLRVEGMWKMDKEKERDITPDNFLKEIKMLRKEGPRRENSKPGAEKSANSTNNSGRSIPSSGSSQLKTALKEATKVKRFVLDQDLRPNTASGYAKSSKGQETKSRKGTKSKASSQESKNSSEDKYKRLVMDFQDSSDNEDKRYRRQNTTAEGKNRQCSLRVDRQRSPIPGKMQERIPTALGVGIGSWGKAMLIPSTDVTPKGGLSEGKEKEKKSSSASQSKEPRKTGKGKADSSEKLGKMELLWPGKAVDWLDQERNAYTPKYDMLRQKGKEKTWNLFEMYGKPTKEKKGKERPNSPGMEESHKHFDLLELLSQKRPEKI